MAIPCKSAFSCRGFWRSFLGFLTLFERCSDTTLGDRLDVGIEAGFLGNGRSHGVMRRTHSDINLAVGVVSP